MYKRSKWCLVVVEYVAFFCIACCIVGCVDVDRKTGTESFEIHKEENRYDLVIAIDGPACSGKGTLARKVAERFRLQHVDTGLIYRKIASLDLCARKKKGITTPLNSASDICIDIASFSPDDALDNSRPELTESILRSEEVSKHTSVIAKFPEVREKVKKVLRGMVVASNWKNGYVIEGRDIGNGVFPRSICKIFLTADPETRARRRLENLRQFDKKITYEEVLSALKERDWHDSHRKFGALRVAEDAVVFDTTHKSIRESVDAVAKIVVDRTRSCGKLLIDRSKEVTLSIIKPDAVHLEKDINSAFEKNGLEIIAQKKVLLTRKQAEKFYAEHRGKEFFDGLCSYMSSGPVIVQVLSGKDAVAKNREIMGSTDPKKAKTGTIRMKFGKDVRHNAVHGSDSKENADREIEFFF
jgi:nucleoside-diphosphate kinase